MVPRVFLALLVLALLILVKSGSRSELYSSGGSPMSWAEFRPILETKLKGTDLSKRLGIGMVKRINVQPAYDYGGLGGTQVSLSSNGYKTKYIVKRQYGMFSLEPSAISDMVANVVKNNNSSAPVYYRKSKKQNWKKERV